MDIATWIVIGLLVACCAIPMLFMGRHGRRGRGKGTVKQEPPEH